MVPTQKCSRCGTPMVKFFTQVAGAEKLRRRCQKARLARLKGDSLRNATSTEVKELRAENARLKEFVGEQALQIQLLKKSLNQ